MAVNDVHVDAPPVEVFALLADGQRYADWVVGAKRIRSVDADWPKVGSKFHHTVGVGPININDSTIVRAVDEPRCLVLEARARPIGRAKVIMEITDDEGGSHIRMTEEPLHGPTVLKRLLDPSIQLRNAEALRRLRELLEPPKD